MDLDEPLNPGVPMCTITTIIWGGTPMKTTVAGRGSVMGSASITTPTMTGIRSVGMTDASKMIGVYASVAQLDRATDF